MIGIFFGSLKIGCDTIYRYKPIFRPAYYFPVVIKQFNHWMVVYWAKKNISVFRTVNGRVSSNEDNSPDFLHSFAPRRKLPPYL